MVYCRPAGWWRQAGWLTSCTASPDPPPPQATCCAPPAFRDSAPRPAGGRGMRRLGRPLADDAPLTWPGSRDPPTLIVQSRGFSAPPGVAFQRCGRLVPYVSLSRRVSRGQQLVRLSQPAEQATPTTTDRSDPPRHGPKYCRLRQAPPDTARHRQTPPDTARHRQRPPETARDRQTPPDNARHRQTTAQTARQRYRP